MKFFKIALLFGFIVMVCIFQFEAQNITNSTDVHSTQGRQPQAINNASVIEESNASSANKELTTSAGDAIKAADPDPPRSFIDVLIIIFMIFGWLIVVIMCSALCTLKCVRACSGRPPSTTIKINDDDIVWTLNDAYL
jgi:cytoskeletal protein RodZ